MRRLVLLLLLLTCLFLAACAGGEPADAADVGAASFSDGPANPESVVAANSEGLVARVNGEGITEQQYQRSLDRSLQNGSASDPAALQRQVLNALIEQTIIRQAGAAMNVDVTEEQARDEVESLKASLDSEEDWQTFLSMNMYTDEEMVQAQRDSLITQQIRDQLVAGLSGDVEQVHARHILVRSETEAQAVLVRLQQGEDFAALAAEYSIDLTTRDNGGDLGWFTRDELMDARLAQVAFDLDPGSIAGPITSSLGYHIIQTLELADRPIDAARLPLLQETVFLNWLSQRTAQASIERFD